jgi:CMP-N,N'-diacetyllegionaminic acid synthase
MEILAIIPARGGSKGIPLKNMINLKGKPLLFYTCNAALSSKLLTKIIISTDNFKIAELGLKYGIEVPNMRPDYLATDETVIIDVIQNELHQLQETGYTPDLVVILQPTSPLRGAHHIDEAIDIMLNNDADSVVSMVRVPHQYSPNSLMYLSDGKLFHYNDEIKIYRRQDKPLLLARNGPAILINKTENILQGSILGNLIYPYIMSHDESVDIDNYADLEYAEYIMCKKETLN